MYVELFSEMQKKKLQCHIKSIGSERIEFCWNSKRGNEKCLLPFDFMALNDLKNFMHFWTKTWTKAKIEQTILYFMLNFCQILTLLLRKRYLHQEFTVNSWVFWKIGRKTNVEQSSNLCRQEQLLQCINHKRRDVWLRDFEERRYDLLDANKCIDSFPNFRVFYLVFSTRFLLKTELEHSNELNNSISMTQLKKVHQDVKWNCEYSLYALSICLRKGIRLSLNWEID